MRSYAEELKYIEEVGVNKWRVKKGFVDNMNVEGIFYANEALKSLVLEELEVYCRQRGDQKGGGFLPALKQLANVAAMPGIVKKSIALPDVHAGYGFAIGNVAAFDMHDPMAVVSPGGVGFDINCGVRVVRTNLMLDDVLPLQESLAQAMFNYIPVGVGSQGIIPCGASSECRSCASSVKAILQL